MNFTLVDKGVPNRGVHADHDQQTDQRVVTLRGLGSRQQSQAAGVAKNPEFRLQYLQIVILDFFARGDGLPGRIGWPHVAINTLDKVSETVEYTV